MEKQYYVIKPIINGFESVFFFYGEQDAIKEYLEQFLAAPFTMMQVNEVLASEMFKVGFKFYMCPLSVDKTETEETTEQEETKE